MARIGREKRTSVYKYPKRGRSGKTLWYKSFQFKEIDPIIFMTKFYPWIINYAFNKCFDPDNPRYLTKTTQTY